MYYDLYEGTFFNCLIQVLPLLLVAAQAYAGVPHVCKTVLENKCRDEPRQSCHSVQKPYTTTVHDTKCTTHYDEKCHTEYDTQASGNINAVNYDFLFVSLKVSFYI